MVFENITVKEELLFMLLLQGHVRGGDKFQELMYFANKTKLPLAKLISITPDGAPAMFGSSSVFIASANRITLFQTLFIITASSISRLYVEKC